jgi:hypothetical protein
MEEAEKVHKAKLDGYDKDLKAYEDYINEKLGLLDKEAQEEDYSKDLSKKKQEALDIQRQIDELMLDSSREAAIKRAELEKMLAEKNEEITDMQTDKEREDRKDNLQQQLEDYQKYIEGLKDAENVSFEDYKEQMEAKSTEAALALEAKRALMNGTMLDVSGNMVTLVAAFTDFQNRFGEGLGVLGSQLQKEFIDKLNEAKKAIAGMSNLNLSVGVGGSYADGGVVNYTGLAAVHGTPSQSEVVLNSSQGAKLYNFIRNLPGIVVPKQPQLTGSKNPVTMSFDNLININGNVDRNVMPRLEDLTNQVVERLTRQLKLQLG